MDFSIKDSVASPVSCKLECHDSDDWLTQLYQPQPC